MTKYAFDPQERRLIATWGTGQGDRATAITTLTPEIGGEHGLILADAMTILADCLWRAYIQPASDSGDSEDQNSPAWRRAKVREAFAEVPQTIANPNLPDERGMMLVSYEPLFASAHRLGRLLHTIADAGLTETICAEFTLEIGAIEAAELGDLQGRARQAVLLSRPEASPAQVAAADAILLEEPLGNVELFTSLDPTAAAVAAAHWLHAAALVAADRSGIDPTNVVEVADDIEALPYCTPTRGLKRLADGQSPYSIVVSLVRDAAVVASGFVPDVEAYLEQIEEAEAAAAKCTGPDQEYVRLAALHSVRLTPLDPARAALDLLEDLLSGIDGCWIIFNEYTDADVEIPGEEDGEGDEHEAAIDEAYEAWRRKTLAEFIELVRQRAKATCPAQG